MSKKLKSQDGFLKADQNMAKKSAASLDELAGSSKTHHERSIFQTFWKHDCCPDFLFLELETSNYGYLLIF